MPLRNIHEIRAGAVLARPVVDHDGRVLLNAGVTLTERYLQTLRGHGFHKLYVRSVAAPETENPIVNVTPAVRSKASRAVANLLTAVDQALGATESRTLEEQKRLCASEGARELGAAGGPYEAVARIAESMLAELEGQRILGGPVVWHADEEAPWQHAVRVAVLSILLGGACGLGPRPLKALAIGALLHDIGKTFFAPDGESNATIIHHTTLGFELVRHWDEAESLAPYVAYEHHEYQDGSGLPRGLVGSNRIQRNRAVQPVPTLVGEIVGVVNVFDNLVSGTRDSGPVPADRALDVLRGHSGTRYNHELVRVLEQVAPPFPVGEDVLIVDGMHAGCVAVVQEVTTRRLTRPIITVYLAADGTVMEPVAIDLQRNPEVVIRGLLYRD